MVARFLILWVFHCNISDVASDVALAFDWPLPAVYYPLFPARCTSRMIPFKAFRQARKRVGIPKFCHPTAPVHTPVSSAPKRNSPAWAVAATKDTSKKNLRRTVEIAPVLKFLKHCPTPRKIPRRRPRAYRICNTVREKSGACAGEGWAGEAPEGPASPQETGLSKAFSLANPSMIFVFKRTVTGRGRRRS